MTKTKTVTAVPVDAKRVYDYYEFQTQYTGKDASGKWYTAYISDHIKDGNNDKVLADFIQKVQEREQQKHHSDFILKQFIDLGHGEYRGRFVLVHKECQNVTITQKEAA